MILTMPWQSETEGLIWIIAILCGSLMAAFGGYLLPKVVRPCAVAVCGGTLGLGTLGWMHPKETPWELVDSFGVALQLDTLNSYFLMTNALVTLAVVIYCWGSDRTAYFYAQLMVLHTSVNAAFLCVDFISLYVALEVVAIAAFCLMTYPRQPRVIWLGLRYLLLSNTAMLFYLLGAILVYQSSHSLQFAGLTQAPPEAIALVCLGLLTKGGVFLSGLWLPQTHGEAASPVSAMLSGVVVKAGILPLLRFSLLSEELMVILQGLGAATALLGVTYAVMAQDSKRLLAFSTVSQVGFILGAPVAGGFYALTHGLVKAGLFLLVGTLPTRNLAALRQTPIAWGLWIPLVLACSSIVGFPLLAGFEAKTLTLKGLTPPLAIALNLAAIGTAVTFSRFIFLRPQSLPNPSRSVTLAIGLLLGGLFVANGIYWEAFTLPNLAKALLTCGVGAVLYWGLGDRLTLALPQAGETVENLIGWMGILLTLLLGLLLL